MEIALHNDKCEPRLEFQPDGSIRVHADFTQSLESLLERLIDLGQEHRQQLATLWSDEQVSRSFEDHGQFVLVRFR